MTKTLAHEILTETGYRSVASLVAEMQADGTDQRLIDRWLQGIEAGLRARREYVGRSVSTLSPVAQTLMARHEARLRRAS